MGWIGETMESIKSFMIRHALSQAITLGMIVASALMIWKGLICVTGCESPIVVVLTGSMEPGIKRGDILFLTMNDDPIRSGEIVVFNVDGRSIPIVHRVIQVHEPNNESREVDILTKGDNNPVDDRGLYSPGQRWLNRHHISGRAVGVDGFRAVVERHLEVEVTGLDQTGKPIKVDASGWQARILQHECDHLEGTIYVDKIVPRTFRTVDNLDLPLAAGCPKLGTR